MKHEDIKEGMMLTVDHDTITPSGDIGFSKGQKVTVKEVWKTDQRWSNAFGMYMPLEVHGVKLQGKYGIYFLSLFSETKHLTTPSPKEI